MNEVPHDQLGRPLRELRISVTDRCNFRCTYCMPREVFGAEYPFLPKAGILSFEEITRLAALFVSLGVEKLRLTGGEPLLRRELPVLIHQLHTLPGLRDLALTTNGSFLSRMAADLRAAGLSRLTVSLDSLDPATFARMADTTVPLAQVLAGLEAAFAAGFRRLKLNCVVKRGVNEHEIPALVARFGRPPYVLRFIEFMDVGNTNGWNLAHMVSGEEILARAAEATTLTPMPRSHPAETARRYRTDEGGEIGLITSITQPFCGACTRARLSAEGRLYTCLFAAEGLDLRTPLRSGASDDDLRGLISKVWRLRSDRYSELRTGATVGRAKAEMSLLGG